LDPNRSILSVPTNAVFPALNTRVELGVFVCVVVSLVGFLPIFAKSPANTEILVGICFAVFCWFSLCTDGLLNHLLTKQAVSTSFRHADAAGMFLFFGVLVGLMLNSTGLLSIVGYTVVRAIALFALIDVGYRFQKKSA